MPDFKPWPEHRNPTREERTATAPYNFVPLPEKIIPAVEDASKLPPHDCFDPERHSGYFEVTLTTRSPLYIRGMVPVEDFQRQDQNPDQKHDRPEFFYTRDQRQPVIPGSSLRGMLRALLEIVSYSKVQWVSKKQLFFRTVDDTAIGRYYRARMGNHVETGFLIRQAGAYSIRACSMAHVKRTTIGGSLYNGAAPHLLPRWQGQPHQYAPVWVRTHKAGRANIDIVDELSYQRRDGLTEGRLVITGDVPRKQKEFVFFLPAQHAEQIPVPEEVINRFHDDDQLTQWQEDAFPTDKPTPAYRERKGMLGNAPPALGDPIFFLREKGSLTFLGRAGMFRLPFTRSPFDLIDPTLRSATQVDYAEALFGFVRNPDELAINVRQGDKRRAYASRISVTDATLQPDQTHIWLAGDFDTVVTPKILATPKPTAFQLYLTQQQPDQQDKLDHYDSNLSGSKTSIRGHKLYWHRGLGTDQGLTLEQIRDAIKEPAHAPPGDTQHTRVKPLKPGVTFSFRIHFENLSEAELGALCWTLHPRGEAGQRYCHHLGMGKPLGMGAVELHARLHIIDRSLRYSALFNGDYWQVGESTAGVGKALEGGDLAIPEVLARLTQPFEKHLLSELNPQPSCSRLADMRRIATLLKLLEWPGQEREKTRYMTIQPRNEYRGRPVLPDPTWFDVPSFEGKSRPQGTQAGMNQSGQTAAPKQQSKPEIPQYKSQPSQPTAPPLTEDQVFKWLGRKSRVTGTVVAQSPAGAILKLDDPTAQPGQQIPMGLLVKKSMPVDTPLTCWVKGIVAGQSEWFVKLES